MGQQSTNTVIRGLIKNGRGDAPFLLNSSVVVIIYNRLHGKAFVPYQFGEVIAESWHEEGMVLE